MRPFPQFPSNSQDLQTLWEEYRQRMISMAGISIFLLGNKHAADGSTVMANDFIREFEIAIENCRIPLPIGATSFAAAKISELVREEPNGYYAGVDRVVPLIGELASPDTPQADPVKKLIEIVKRLGK